MTRQRRSAKIPTGSWPRRMAADLAAGYCGEPTVEDFLKRVGKEYPNPRVKEGRRQLWLFDDLDNAIVPRHLRTAEKLTVLARKAWKVVQRLYPLEFNKDVPNPWIGVTMKTRVKQIKAAVTRDQVYEFANGCIDAGEVEVAAIAVICFEWLQRPENVIAGHIKWTDHRNPKAPTIVPDPTSQDESDRSASARRNIAGWHRDQIL
jgi:hypothetical protein